MAKYIDENGFAHFLGKLKTLLDGKSDTGHTHDYAAYSHKHGNIQSGGTLQTTDVTIADGDKLVVTDSSSSNKIARTSVSFDGSTENKCLSKKGTWVDVNNYSLPTASASTKGGVKIGSGLTMTGEVLSADEMTGITDDPNNGLPVAGAAGMVPAPSANDDARVLTSRGKWGTYNFSLLGGAGGAFSGEFVLQLYEYDAQNNGAATQVASLQIPDASASEKGFMSASDYQKLAALPTNSTLQSTYALKSDITSMYKHKGSVSAFSNLPSSNNTAGDVYNVTATNMNYVWVVPESGDPYWDPLGEVFTIDSMTTTEIDTAFVTAGLAVAS